jgi:hypothetical protein
MHEAAISEFPFVAELPKREKSKLEKVWDHLAEVRAVTAQRGPVIPQIMAAHLLNIGRARVGQLVDDGKLETVLVNGVRYVTADSVEAWAKSNRGKGGRPRKVSNLELAKASLEGAREIFKNTSK